MDTHPFSAASRTAPAPRWTRRAGLAVSSFLLCLGACHRPAAQHLSRSDGPSTEAIHADIATILAESQESVAEEWAIHDYEGFGGA